MADVGLVEAAGGCVIAQPEVIRVFEYDCPSFSLLPDGSVALEVKGEPKDTEMDEVQSEVLVRTVEEDDMLFVDELIIDEKVDVQLVEFDDLADLSEVVGQFPVDSSDTNAPLKVSNDGSALQTISIAGLQDVPCLVLHAAGKGIEKSKSMHNDSWSLRRADQLRVALQWDMHIPFGDLEFGQLDELLSNLFFRVKKIKGGDYPSETLMNMLEGFNRLIRRASDLRSLCGDMRNIVGRDFCIKKHPAFVKTRLTLKAAVRKTALDGNNKKTKKVETLTECHEDAILADIKHQLTVNTSAQKRLIFYLVTRCGIRGGGELYELQQKDLDVRRDKQGWEYVWFEERTSKNNDVTLEQYKEVQFRATYYNYECDYVLMLKQYLRPMPPLGEGVKLDLFLGCIHNPAGIIWFNRANKVSIEKCKDSLRAMAKLVGIDPDVFSNKSGRATLITRMAARGVPDEVGMTVSGHHTTFGYGRYDCTKELKQEATTLVSHTPSLSYDAAFKQVSTKFVKEKLVGTLENVHPLMDAASEQRMKELKLEREQQVVQQSEERSEQKGLFVPERAKEVISAILQEKLNGVKYDAKTATLYVREISDAIKTQLRDMDLDRYKLVVQAMLGEQRGQGFQMSCRCFWDPNMDNYAHDSYSNESIFCVASAFALYMP